MSNDQVLTKETPANWLEKIENIKNQVDADQFHCKKRVGSYIWTNSLVCDCASGNCPYRDIAPTLIYALADISIDQYVRMKAYYLTESGQHTNEVDAYYDALKRVESIFRCSLPPKVDGEIFDHDNNELTDMNRFYVQYHGARARRAFWLYLKHEPDNDQYMDYVATCAYIENLTALSTNPLPKRTDLYEMEKLIKNNYSIATPIDLYRYCYMRKHVVA